MKKSNSGNKNQNKQRSTQQKRESTRTQKRRKNINNNQRVKQRKNRRTKQSMKRRKNRSRGVNKNKLNMSASRKQNKSKLQRGGFNMYSGSGALYGSELVGKCDEAGGWMTDWDAMDQPGAKAEGDIKSCGDGSLDMIEGAERDGKQDAAKKLSNIGVMDEVAADTKLTLDEMVAALKNDKNVSAEEKDGELVLTRDETQTMDEEYKTAGIEDPKVLASLLADDRRYHAKYDDLLGTGKDGPLSKNDIDALKAQASTAGGVLDVNRHKSIQDILDPTVPSLTKSTAGKYLDWEGNISNSNKIGDYLNLATGGEYKTPQQDIRPDKTFPVGDK